MTSGLVGCKCVKKVFNSLLGLMGILLVKFYREEDLGRVIDCHPTFLFFAQRDFLLF